MTETILERDMRYAAQQAALVAAEKHYFDAAQPFVPLGFSVTYRNLGHWDIYAPQTPGKISAWLAANPGGSTTAHDGGNERAFCIRGEPSNVIVRDERWNPHNPHPRESARFASVQAAMAWISEELMQEPRDVVS